MDAVVILIVGFILCCFTGKETMNTIQKEVVTLESRLNPDFYEDQNAFMVIANELGFN